LREFTLGYTFKTGDQGKGFLRKSNRLSVALIGRNLFAISDMPHIDPEQLAVQGQQFVSGVENMSYATTRSFGLKLGFDF